MFSSKSLKYMRKTVETVDFWGTLPYTWDKINNQIEQSKAPGRKFIWYFHIFAQTAHFLFLLGRYIQFKYFVEAATPSVKIYCEYAMLSYSIPVMFQLCILARLNEMTDFFHDFTQLFSQVQAKFGIQASVGRDCDRFLTFMWRSGKLISWINVVILFRRPARPVLLTSLMNNPANLRPWEIVPFAVPHVFVWWSMWSCLHLWSIYLLTYVYSVIAIARAFAVVKPNEVQMKKMTRLYRCLQLLQKKQAGAYGICLAAHKILFALVVVRSIYSAVVIHSEVRVLLTVVGMSTWFYLHVAFKTLGQIYVASDDALQAWKIYGQNHLFRRFLRSCPPLKVKISFLYYVDRGLPLTLATVILESIVNLLLAHK